jgi:hypothetical protein
MELNFYKQTGRDAMGPIVEDLTPPVDLDRGEECLRTGGWWVHLRMCETCGQIGCCDSSPNRHASRHARHDDHPVARSVEPGEDWSWCYLDQVGFVLDSGD